MTTTMKKTSNDMLQASVSRRGFLKSSAGVGLLTAIGGSPILSYLAMAAPTETKSDTFGKWVASTCQGCTSWCPVQVRVVDGRAIDVRGNPFSKANHGEICPRPPLALQQVYDPDRI